MHRKDSLFNLPLTSRMPYVFLDKGVLRVDGHCLVLSKNEDEVEIPAGRFASLMLEPGVSVTHEAVKLASENDVQMVWVGDGGTRLYSASNMSGNPQRLVQQVKVISDLRLRISAARRLYLLMFCEQFPPSHSIEKLRGSEGARVRAEYIKLAKENGIHWDGRKSDDGINQAISFGTSCLYSLSEIAIITLGFSPLLGVVHSGDQKSFVYDVADTVKFQVLMPIIFKHFAKVEMVSFSDVRKLCRDEFVKGKLLDRLIDNATNIVFGY